MTHFQSHQNTIAARANRPPCGVVTTRMASQRRTLPLATSARAEATAMIFRIMPQVSDVPTICASEGSPK